MYGILTQEEWNSHMIGKTLENFGIPFIWIDIKDIITFHGSKPHVKSKTHILDECEKIYVRAIPIETIEQAFYNINLLHRLENIGVECINSPSVIGKCLDKSFTTSLFEDAGLRVPRTVCCRNYDDAFAAFLEMKDVVVKPLCGSHGIGMTRVNTEEMANRLFRYQEFHKFIFYVQEYLEHNNEGFRLLTCQEEFVSTYKIKAPTWNANVHQGGKPEKSKASEEMVEMALTASRVLGCHYCEFDIIESFSEPYIIEANWNPDLEFHQLMQDFDVVSKVVELLR
jgi:RimK family alpha-L-glutamate ligase